MSVSASVSLVGVGCCRLSVVSCQLSVVSQWEGAECIQIRVPS
jgi:hypothetical protein